MALIVNLRHLEEKDVVLRGELPVAELDLDTRDEMVCVKEPLRYDLQVQLLEDSLLARGWLRLTLECQCVRCLKPFLHELELNPWACHLPLEGEEPAPIVNDCADLTPSVREDMLLELPRHPLCQPDCRGLEKTTAGPASGSSKDESAPSAWAELDKLKL